MTLKTNQNYNKKKILKQGPSIIYVDQKDEIMLKIY
jgi:hypothetical protein